MGRKARTPDTELSYDELEQRWTPLMTRFTHRCYQLENDDMMQELRIKLWHAQTKFDPSRGVKFGTYLYRAFQNTAAHHANRYHPNESLDKRIADGYDVGASDDYGLAELSCITGKSSRELEAMVFALET